jgi:hypothetical protein
MKKGILLLMTSLAMTTAFAQEGESEKNDSTKKTFRIGNIVVIKKGDGQGNVAFSKDKDKKSNSRFTTNWFALDLGFSNFSDKSDYSNPSAFIQNDPNGLAMNGYDFKTKNGKSINVNVWFFMQRMNLVKENVSLKYGLGLELNNYRFKSTVSFREGGTLPYTGAVTNQPYVFRDTISFSKNKLAADYLTLPVMLSFSSNENKNGNKFGISGGVSFGYLYSSRNKQVSDERCKKKNRGDFDMESFKISYIGEVELGPVKLYGSYSPKSMFKNDLNFQPYTFGIRLSDL